MMFYQEESLVLVNAEWRKLRFDKILPGSLKLVFRTKWNESETPYVENLDFEVDYEKSLIRRISSTVPNYADSPFYNVEKFSHESYEVYGNYSYMLWVSYLCASEMESHEALSKKRTVKVGSPLLQKTIENIKDEKPFTYCVFGDSISTGAEASETSHTYFERFGNYIKNIGGDVTIINKAVGGDTSSDGMKRFKEDVLPLSADLVSIAFGMNDQNIGEANHFVEPAEYKQNITEMVKMLKEMGSEVVLITPCLPNSLWKYTSGDMQLYVDCLFEISRELNVAIADLNHLWKKELESGKTESSLLLNDINHPTSYGHYLYFCALKSLI